MRTWQLPSNEEIDHLRSSVHVATLAVSADGKELFLAGDHLTVVRLDGGTALWEMTSHVDNVGAASTDLGFVACGVGSREDNHGPYTNTAVELYDGVTGRLLSRGEHATVMSGTGKLKDKNINRDKKLDGP